MSEYQVGDVIRERIKIDEDSSLFEKYKEIEYVFHIEQIINNDYVGRVLKYLINSNGIKTAFPEIIDPLKTISVVSINQLDNTSGKL